KNIPNLPPWGTVWSVAPSKFDAGTAYVVENLQHEGIYDALVYETADYGATWKLISSGVPKGVNSSAHIIVEDPVRKGMLYLGTDNALYVTWDDGAKWTRLRNDRSPAIRASIACGGISGTTAARRSRCRRRRCSNRGRRRAGSTRHTARAFRPRGRLCPRARTRCA